MRKCVIFGNCFYNTIGLVRSLGEAGYKVDLLVIGKSAGKCSYRFSKYVHKYLTADSDENGLVVLQEEYANETEKTIVLFAGDPPACVMDRHYDELKERFCFFNCGEQGRLTFYMEKINTFPIAERSGLALIKTWKVSDVRDLPSDITFPCLIKGGNSTKSHKGHMCVCRNAVELRTSLCEGIEYLIQEYIEKDYELNIVGFSWNHGEDVLAPAVVRKIRDDLHRQSVYIRLDALSEYPDFNVEIVRRFLREMKYEGIFSIEVLKSKGKYYFLEVNLRNDGCGYLFTAGGVNYPALWVKYCRGELQRADVENIRLKAPIHLMHWDDVYNMLEGKVGIFKWLGQAFTADAHFVMNHKDMKPFLSGFRDSFIFTMKKVLKMLFLRVGRSRKMQKGIMYGAYYCGGMRIFRFLNRHAKKIVTFHNVLPDELYDRNLANGTALEASRFEKIVRRLAKEYRISTDLMDPKTLTISFDDGYCCQAEIAGSILSKVGNCPAIVFYCGQTQKAREPKDALVIDQLLFWVSYAPIQALETYVGDRVHDRIADCWVGKLWGEYCLDAEKLGQNILKRLNGIYPFEKVYAGLNAEYLRLRMTGIPKDVQKNLEERGWMFAWHTENHHPLSFLTSEQLRSEMTAACSRQMNMPFSYPYGSLETVGLREIAMAEELGYPCAVSNTDPNQLERQGKHFMTRLSLSGNKIEDEFTLSGLNYFLKTGHLFPK